MILLVEQQKDAIAGLCRRYNIERLYIFGSAADDRFDGQRSDLDFLVKLAQRESTGHYADRVLDLAGGFEMATSSQNSLRELNWKSCNFQPPVRYAMRPVELPSSGPWRNKACNLREVPRQRLRQNLDGDIAVELRILRAEHLAHTACTNRRNDFVRSDA